MEARPGAGRSLDRSIEVPQNEFVGGLLMRENYPSGGEDEEAWPWCWCRRTNSCGGAW